VAAAAGSLVCQRSVTCSMIRCQSDWKNLGFRKRFKMWYFDCQDRVQWEKLWSLRTELGPDETFDEACG
jgi:hypothetical protein